MCDRPPLPLPLPLFPSSQCHLILTLASPLLYITSNSLASLENRIGFRKRSGEGSIRRVIIRENCAAAIDKDLVLHDQSRQAR